MSNQSPESVRCEPAAMAEDLVRALRAVKGTRALSDLRRAAAPGQQRLPALPPEAGALDAERGPADGRTGRAG